MAASTDAPPTATASQEDKGNLYTLHRDYRASVRLNYNHFLMREFSGYLIHPSIPTSTSTSSPLRIAEVATGTAIWALDVCTQLPSASVYGFDISTSQYPPASQHPQNLTLHVHDAFDPFPASFLGTFDIVHLRFLMCVVTESSAPILLTNLIALLKPGGYLQWYEPLAGAVFAAAPPTTETSIVFPAVERLALNWRTPADSSSYNWIENLPNLFAAAGLDVIATHRILTPERHRYTFMLSNVSGIEDGWGAALISGGDEDGMKRWIAELMEEFRRGAYADVQFTCVVGRKKQGKN